MMEKLNEREKLFVIGGVAVILITGLVYGIIYILNQRQTIRDSVFETREQVAAMVRLKSAIQSMPAGQSAPEKSRFLQSVNTLLEKHNLTYSSMRERKEKADGRRGAEVTLLEINFNGIQLQSLIQFLYDVEVRKQTGGRVYRLDIVQPLPGVEKYDVNLSIGIETAAAN